MRYPCSYMIYSEVFDGLPAEAKDAIYRRLWRVMETRFTGETSKAIVEILRETKKGLPDYFAVGSR